MNGYQSTFKRVEKKYLLSEAQYMELRLRLEEHMRPDQFAKSTICNIYFDTPDSRLIRTSLEKPVYKEKLRLRSYGTPDSGSKVFIELKKKYKGVVYKRRADMRLCQAEDYLYRGLRPEDAHNASETQIFREIDWFLQFYEEIGPAMYLSYDRAAFSGREDAQLRMTFDTNIRYRTEALELMDGIWGAELLETGQRLLEIKIPGAMPLWLSHLLSELQIYPSSFSKYGKAYMVSTAAELAGGGAWAAAVQEPFTRQERESGENGGSGSRPREAAIAAAAAAMPGQRLTEGGWVCA